MLGLPGLSSPFDMQGCLSPLPQTWTSEAMFPHEPSCMLSHEIRCSTCDLSHFWGVHLPSYRSGRPATALVNTLYRNSHRDGTVTARSARRLMFPFRSMMCFDADVEQTATPVISLSIDAAD